MVEYAYTTVTGKIKPLLEKMRTIGIPQKVSTSWLKTIGFTSSNDKSLITVLKFIGLVDQGNIPTPQWNSYRGNNYKTVLGEAIRNGYSDLYAIYPDAHNRTNKEISHVFSTSSSAGAQVINKTVATFKALAEEADFSENTSTVETILHSNKLHEPIGAMANPVPDVPSAQNGPEVHIDIQIHISPESTSQQIDKIFESMARHLYGRKGE